MTPQDTMRLALEQAYERGWIEAACWAQRDDLCADVGSPAYINDRAPHLDAVEAALAQQGEQPVAWPQTPEQISDFIGSNFVWREGNDVAPKDGDKYCVTAHDLLSAFREWPEFAAAPAAQPLSEDEISFLARGKTTSIEFARAIEEAHGIGVQK